MKTTEEIIYDYVEEEEHCLKLCDIEPNVKWFREDEILDAISATTIKSNRYGHEGYIDAELLKIALFKNYNPTNVGINKQEVDQNEKEIKNI